MAILPMIQVFARPSPPKTQGPDPIEAAVSDNFTGARKSAATRVFLDCHIFDVALIWPMIYGIRRRAHRGIGIATKTMASKTADFSHPGGPDVPSPPSREPA
jgi:hypothetical protein